jgi:hypothetical protein
MCLVHIFEIREAKIAKEIAFEMCKVVPGDSLYFARIW